MPYIDNKEEKIDCDNANILDYLMRIYWIRRSLTQKPYKISPVDRDIYTMVSVNDPRFSAANKISDPYNYPSNNSMGDILLLISKYEVYFESKEALSFISAVKIFYSILLYENMFFKSSLNLGNLIDKTAVLRKTELKNRTDAYTLEKEDVMPIQLLIGGTTYFPHSVELIRKRTPSRFTDSDHPFYFSINLDELPSEPKGEGVTPYFIQYYGERRPPRTEPEHIYDTTRKPDIDEKARFDVLSYLVNTLNPMRTYKRFAGSTKCNINDITVNLLKWICNNVTIKMEKEDDDHQKYHPVPFLPLYSVDIMLRLITYTHKGEKDEKFDKTVEKYYNDIIEKVSNWVGEYNGGKAKEHIKNIIELNPLTRKKSLEVNNEMIEYLSGYYK